LFVESTVQVRNEMTIINDIECPTKRDCINVILKINNSNINNHFCLASNEYSLQMLHFIRFMTSSNPEYFYDQTYIDLAIRFLGATNYAKIDVTNKRSKSGFLDHKQVQKHIQDLHETLTELYPDSAAEIQDIKNTIEYQTTQFKNKNCTFNVAVSSQDKRLVGIVSINITCVPITIRQKSSLWFQVERKPYYEYQHRFYVMMSPSPLSNTLTNLQSNWFLKTQFDEFCMHAIKCVKDENGSFKFSQKCFDIVHETQPYV
jgi:hypothetical protein